MNKNKFIVLKDNIINISDIVYIEYYRDIKVLYIELRDKEPSIRIDEFYNMDYRILLNILSGEDK